MQLDAAEAVPDVGQLQQYSVFGTSADRTLRRMMPNCSSWADIPAPSGE